MLLTNQQATIAQFVAELDRQIGEFSKRVKTYWSYQANSSQFKECTVIYK